MRRLSSATELPASHADGRQQSTPAQLGSVRAPAASGSASALRGPADKIRAFVALTKPRIIELLLVTTVPLMIVAAEGLPPLTLIAVTVVGGALAAGGANTVNMVIDRDIDARMTRTMHRPLVTGAVTPAAALAFGAVLELVAFALLWRWANLLAAVLAFGAFAFYVGVYSLWLKRRSPQNIVIGGAAGAAPALIGWAAVADSLSAVPWIAFAIIFFWTPPHFWALAIRYADDYSAAAVPMLPSVAGARRTIVRIAGYTVIVIALSFWFGAAAGTGLLYWAVAVVGGAAFAFAVAALWRAQTVARAMALFHFSIAYLGVLFAAMAVDVLVRHGL